LRFIPRRCDAAASPAGRILPWADEEAGVAVPLFQDRSQFSRPPLPPVLAELKCSDTVIARHSKRGLAAKMLADIF